MKTRLTLTVNGETQDLLVPVHKTLLEVLREDLGLTGTKHGCELGECGTCTVLVDGAPVLSCLALTRRAGGPGDHDGGGAWPRAAALHPLQQAFAELGAAQCGYCTPGILLTARALLGERPDARRATRSRRRWPATSAGARATRRSWKPSSWRRSAWPPAPGAKGVGGR